MPIKKSILDMHSSDSPTIGRQENLLVTAKKLGYLRQI